VAPVSLAFAQLDTELARELEQLAPYDEITVIVTLNQMERPELHSARDRSKRNGDLVKALKKHAEFSQAGIKKHIKKHGLKHLKDIWIVNGLVIKLRADQVHELAALPGIASVRKDEIVTLATPLPSSSGAVPEWNLNALKLPDVWAAGNTGVGVVVATMDTGVDIYHPDLAGKWRGGSNSWFDPSGQHANPHDASGHGTQVMGILVGGNASGAKIGVAPDAKYIAAKIFDDNGTSTYSAIHAAFQWLLDPDNNPATQDAPDVVNASWGLPGTNNKCNVEFDTDIRMLKAANIAVVFAGGNDGPAPATGVSPANSAGVMSSGSIGSTLDISSFSSRGASPCTNGVFPTLVAPGDGIYTADLTSGAVIGYTYASGTSFATPHVAGVLALLAGKFPSLTVSELELSLTQTAQDLGDTGADNNYGAGLLNAKAALLALTGRPAGSTPVVTSLPPVVAMQGAAYIYQVVAADADGNSMTFTLDVFPPGMSISASGQIFWIPGSSQSGQQLVTVRVTDTTGLYVLHTFVVAVANDNNAPVANDDTYLMVQGSSLTVPAPGVLTNDTDKDSNHLVAVNYGSATTGSLSGNGDGSFVYIPPTTAFVGIVTFRYQASDGALTSAAATVTINVVAAAGGPLTFPAPQFPVNPTTGYPATPVPDPIPVETGGSTTGRDQTQSAPDLEKTTTADDGTEPVKPEKTPKEDTTKENEVADKEGTPVITSAAIEFAKQGEVYNYQLALNTEAACVYTLDVAPDGMVVNEMGMISWTPSKKQPGNPKVVVRVTDAAKRFTTQTFTIAVENVNEAPVAVSDSFTLPQASVLTVAAPGVLKNDTDADMKRLEAVGYSLPSIGSLEGNSDGSFSYVPPSPEYTGVVTFTYKASDGELTSNEANVQLKIVASRAPRAVDDLANAHVRLPVVAYVPLTINVLENDVNPDSEFEPGNKIVASSLKIVSQPNRGGKLVLDSESIISYTPAIGFKGVETFSYSVKNTRKLLSNTANVRINVR
jgi:subtilisin family serine protease